MNFYLNLVKGGIVVAILFAAVQAPVTASESKTPLQKQTCPSLLNHHFMTLQGEKLEFCQFSGKVLLVVNTASYCGYTKQYAGLQALYEKYQGQGFEILGFPANNFMGQEPGTDAEIQQFCKLKYDVEFPMFSKISVKGDDIAPLYSWLTTGAGYDGDIEWNFAKFLVGPDGRVIARFHPDVEPLDPALVAQVEAALPAR